MDAGALSPSSSVHFCLGNTNIQKYTHFFPNSPLQNSTVVFDSDLFTSSESIWCIICKRVEGYVQNASLQLKTRGTFFSYDYQSSLSFDVSSLNSPHSCPWGHGRRKDAQSGLQAVTAFAITQFQRALYNPIIVWGVFRNAPPGPSLLIYLRSGHRSPYWPATFFGFRIWNQFHH